MGANYEGQDVPRASKAADNQCVVEYELHRMRLWFL
jgi:hypothetical protein